MKEKKQYLPISCVYYDLIEHYAVRKEVVHIIIEQGEEQKEYQSKILDTKIQDKIEYMLIETPELSIRMDQIISLNGEKLSDFTAC